jgi:putative tryptophan/tyrosine transport system substrate-binding protein
MRRRKFILTLAGAAAWPFAARAQQEQLRRIGALFSIANDSEGQARVAAFRDGLQKLGWIEDRNVRIDSRWGAANPDRLRAHAAELVSTRPDVILAGASSALAALHDATREVPIVFAQVPDPVGSGFIASLSHPGGNITGFATFEYAVGVKWAELLKELAPRLARLTFLYDPTNPNWAGYFREIKQAASSLGLESTAAAAGNAEAIKRAFDALADGPNAGLIPLNSPTIIANRELIIDLAVRHRTPAVYGFRYFATSGGLASYGVDNIELYRRAAAYVDRILKGEKPADLPVQQATKFELVINLKTARALGLDISPTLLARADEVIE